MIRYHYPAIGPLLPGNCTHHAPDGSYQRAQRRYADYSRGKRLPVAAGRGDPEVEHLSPHYQLEVNRRAAILIHFLFASS